MLPTCTDYEYYLAQQILPPIERLCEPIEGTDKARLAECLGLDVQRYAAKSGGDVEREFNTLGSQISDKERFSDCEPFRIRCNACDAEHAKFGGLLDDPVCPISPLSTLSTFLGFPPLTQCFGCSLYPDLLHPSHRPHLPLLPHPSLHPLPRRPTREPDPIVHHQILRGHHGLR